jgi:predicted nucleic acid-binding protein
MRQLSNVRAAHQVTEFHIAAIARRHNLMVATGNVKDFQRPGVKVFNPFAESES